MVSELLGSTSSNYVCSTWPRGISDSNRVRITRLFSESASVKTHLSTRFQLIRLEILTRYSGRAEALESPDADVSQGHALLIICPLASDLSAVAHQVSTELILLQQEHGQYSLHGGPWLSWPRPHSLAPPCFFSCLRVHPCACTCPPSAPWWTLLFPFKLPAVLLLPNYAGPLGRLELPLPRSRICVCWITKHIDFTFVFIAGEELHWMFSSLAGAGLPEIGMSLLGWEEWGTWHLTQTWFG